MAKKLRSIVATWPEELDNLFRMQAIRLAGARLGITALRYTALPGTNRSNRVLIAELAHPLSEESTETVNSIGWEVVPQRLSKSLKVDEMLDATEELLRKLGSLPETPITAVADSGTKEPA